jgi:hypothetical protein
MILKVVMNQSLWIWHCHFQLFERNNDLNVLDHSPLVIMLKGISIELSFEVSGHVYFWYYLLVDGIHPWWFIFVQTIHEPQGEKKKVHFVS